MKKEEKWKGKRGRDKNEKILENKKDFKGCLLERNELK